MNPRRHIQARRRRRRRQARWEQKRLIASFLAGIREIDVAFQAAAEALRQWSIRMPAILTWHHELRGPDA